MNKRLLARLVLFVWVSLWLLFLARPYVRSGLLKEYAALIRAPSLELKQANVMGEELYDFIKLCGNLMPPHSTYEIIGLGDDTLAYRRVVYYLYPDIPAPSPEFLLIYKTKNFQKAGYGMFKDLKEEKSILRKESR